MVSDMETREDLATELEEMHAALAAMAETERVGFLTTLAPAERMAFNWWMMAHPYQVPPSTGWSIWLLLAGRGSGKTRAAVEWILNEASQKPKSRWAVVGRTNLDVKNVMFEGESGLYTLCPPELIADYRKSVGSTELVLTNGARLIGYSAETPEKLRGPEHHGAWADEIASWTDAHLGPAKDTAWSNLMLTLRLGDHPKVVATTTPKPVSLLKRRPGDEDGTPGLLEQENVHLSTATTDDNIHNLAPTFRQQIELFRGTRLGQQELQGLLIQEAEGAFWTIDGLNEDRVTCDWDKPATRPSIQIPTIVVDPSVSNEDGDQCGIIVGGLGLNRTSTREGHGYILDDTSGQFTVDGWAAEVVRTAKKWGEILGIDYRQIQILAEDNNGGALVAKNVLVADPSLKVKLFKAKGTKAERAYGASILYGAHRIHHVNSLPALESEMTTWTDGEKWSPNRLDAAAHLVNFWFGKLTTREYQRTGKKIAQARV